MNTFSRRRREAQSARPRVVLSAVRLEGGAVVPVRLGGREALTAHWSKAFAILPAGQRLAQAIWKRFGSLVQLPNAISAPRPLERAVDGLPEPAPGPDGLAEAAYFVARDPRRPLLRGLRPSC